MLEPVALADETRVGEWIQMQDEANSFFWTPPQCPNNILHTHAEQKHFTERFYYKTPSEPGQGDIEIRGTNLPRSSIHRAYFFYLMHAHTRAACLALIKRGPANDGEFYFPAAFPVLREVSNDGNSSATNVTGTPGPGSTSGAWFLGEEFESCEAVCVGQGLVCDAAAMDLALQDATKVSTYTTHAHARKPPSLSLAHPRQRHAPTLQHTTKDLAGVGRPGTCLGSALQPSLWWGVLGYFPSQG